MRRHARVRIDFKEIEAAGRLHHEIDTAPAPGSDHAVSLFNRFRHGARRLLGEISGAGIADFVPLILVHAVVVAVRRHDFNDGKRFRVFPFAEHGAGEFTAVDTAFNDEVILHRKRPADRVSKRLLSGVLKLLNAKGAAVLIRLHDETPAKTADDFRGF